ncbi:Uma2 family endonuclease [Gordonia sp. HNM0687]|uniref:Uma2 family endonuclease n=1 Tax=Gordonia mangrovi TaxID=2665643 RepID=A0A6L7GIK2_9ACTN|nr:Uma2 family endonuclease [Gordonia mangrovi]MXP19790.1 Uma2 family endonuclease [Gordonia mangrovi]UVF79583.1 Uma2 family endonuclease [Gordonia mangrovi]
MSGPAHAHLLSLDEWWALGEDQEVRVELQEGVRIVSPRPRPAHARVVLSLATQLSGQLPAGLEVLIEVDVVIDPHTPATVRVPDLIVRRRSAVEFPITADQVVLAIEVMSPGSRRTDRVTKSSEYAEAGIPHYWIVDEDGVVTALDLTSGGYLATSFTGEVVTSNPWPMRISLKR